MWELNMCATNKCNMLCEENETVWQLSLAVTCTLHVITVYVIKCSVVDAAFPHGITVCYALITIFV